MAGHRLTGYQKWTLATTVFAIYWPIRLYVNMDSISLAILQRIWLLLLFEVAVTISFFVLWLTVTDWIQERFFSQRNKEFLVEFSLPAQLATFVVAGALAVLFNWGNLQVWRTMAAKLHISYPVVQPSQATSQVAQYRLQDRQRRQKVFNGLTVMAMLSAFYLAANRRGYKRLESVRIKAEQLKQEATQTQFNALKNQINPHFLFNSLSILSSLVEVNPRLSIQFISQLARTYRFVLEQRDSDCVKLQAELSFMDAYMFLLDIRFRNKLIIVKDVPPEHASRYNIAPLTLQLLIENAVKHNQMSVEEPLRVTIQTEGDYLLVANPIRVRPQMEVSTGMGLKNIKDRYRLLTERPVWIGEQNGHFLVKIPLLA